VIELLRGYLVRRPADPKLERRALGDERERLVQAALARLAGDPEREQEFRHALAAAQAASPLHETHAFYIDQRGFAAVRLALLSLGRRLARVGRLADAEDVWYCLPAELEAALTGEADLHAIAEARRLEHAAQFNVEPPERIGAPPPPREGGAGDSKFSGSAGPPQVADGVLRGAPGSRGRVTGTARVVHRYEELGRVRPGEILVCRSTTPPWTPIFASIAGLVTDTGGVLAHGAVVAREYRIPAVLGTKVGTRLIRDGQRITVDGDRGKVVLEPVSGT
jgi:phosphohistidine swiveling domain-containing protein